MKKRLVSILFLFAITINFAQSAFDKSIKEASIDLAEKLTKKGKTKVAVVCVTEINKEETVAGKYIADEISVNIVNGSGNFQVFDRESISGIAAVKRLVAEGYINNYKAKELGKLLAVEVVIVGNYTVKNKAIKLTMSAYDSYSGLVIASTNKDLPIDSDAGALLGINVDQGENRNNSNRGFNDRPINSYEDYNNPRTVNSDCKKNNTGDYCFTNTSRYTPFTVTIANRSMILQPLQTQCFYELPAGPHNYVITFRGKVPIMSFPPGAPTIEQDIIYLQGEIRVEQCKSKTFAIRQKTN